MADLDKKYYQAKPFYWVIIISLLIGLAINYIGINPVQALIYTAILYGVTSPVLIAVILHISNNKKIMGKFTNGKMVKYSWSNCLVTYDGFSSFAYLFSIQIINFYSSFSFLCKNLLPYKLILPVAID